MPFSQKGWQTLGAMGSPDGSAGSRRSIHTYISNDTRAAVETANYFLPIFRALKVGDVLIVSHDNDGTLAVRMYYIATVSPAGVTIARDATTVTGAQTGITDLGAPTNVGATNSGDVSAAINTNFTNVRSKINEIINALEAAGLTVTV